MKTDRQSRIFYSQKLPRASQFSEETVLLYDSILVKNKNFRSWAESFPYRIPLRSGEGLKTLGSLDSVLNKISKMGVSKSARLTFVAAGGGSVGDFAGFLASVYLRGRRLVSVPSTWLSAVDSAHGGKTGLNFQGSKNQLGTFWPADEIYIVKELLLMQPPGRLQEAMGEVIKMAVLGDKKLFGELEGISAGGLYRELPRVIGLKYKVVKKDPLEKNGTRRLLNLGHTLGHVFESHFGWPHGTAVLLGLQFSARWSLQRGLLSENDFMRISLLAESLNLGPSLNEALRKLSPARLKKLLLKDKKLTAGSRLEFIFIRGVGRCARLSVEVGEILAEAARQKAEY